MQLSCTVLSWGHFLYFIVCMSVYVVHVGCRHAEGWVEHAQMCRPEENDGIVEDPDLSALSL